MLEKTIKIRLIVTGLLILGGFVFPYLFILAAFFGWTIIDSLRNPPAPPPQEWYALRWTTTKADPKWKTYFLPFCDSPAETAFLEAMIPAFGLTPEKGILTGVGLSLNLQVKIPPYRVDFLANEWLVIEIDGAAYHSSPEAVARDRSRDEYLRGKGYTTIRIPAKIVFNKPDEAVQRVRTAISASQKVEATATSKPTQPGPLENVNRGIAAVNNFITEVSRDLTVGAAVQKATSPAEIAFHAERTVITKALQRAADSLETEDRFANDEKARKLYEANVAAIKAVLGDDKKITFEIPVITAPPSHSDTDIDARIQRAHQQLMGERAAYFAEVRQQLVANPRLQALVKARLEDIECSACWTTIWQLADQW
ncbi:endonuclease domain-containing protein [Paracraurococcus lichenis]|uniref:DUF559 domain-containing protein n=1 Tax=Paracraurococcus lichenis TaxID=3064888 RepID=A0ABT9E4F2_9PROT|nr:DUF559 domain-containing protein [Paracraurococcus sp. LOR1-02]MDO9711033.1 DUF559 domain-containing protein [Paracraurococcus sp. LOR1-02]